MGDLKLMTNCEFHFHLEHYLPLYQQNKTDYRVGCIEISSKTKENNSMVSEFLTRWILENGWSGLVGVRTHFLKPEEQALGFNAARVRFVPGELQSNGGRDFVAELPSDLNNLSEELEYWLMELDPAPSAERVRFN